jgi:hypothetical protein
MDFSNQEKVQAPDWTAMAGLATVVLAPFGIQDITNRGITEIRSSAFSKEARERRKHKKIQ